MSVPHIISSMFISIVTDSYQFIATHLRQYTNLPIALINQLDNSSLIIANNSSGQKYKNSGLPFSKVEACPGNGVLERWPVATAKFAQK